MHARAIHDEGAGFRVEEVIADAEAFGRAPDRRRVVLNFELGVRGSRPASRLTSGER